METRVDKKTYSPLVLAYIGDAVYELYVRSRIVAEKNVQVNKLHCEATGYVSANAQFEAFHLIEDQLTERETEVYKRGRNAKSQSVPKNAELSHYRVATGLEALVGYLYINEEHQRLEYLLKTAFDKMNERKQDNN